MDSRRDFLYSTVRKTRNSVIVSFLYSIQNLRFRTFCLEGGLTRHVHVHDKLYRLLMRGRYKEERLERRKTVPAGRVGNEEGMEISRPGKWSGWGDSRGSVSAGS